MNRQDDLLDRLIKQRALNPRDRLQRAVTRRIREKPGSRAWHMAKLRNLSREVQRAGWIADHAASYLRLVADALNETIKEVEGIGRKRRN